MKNMLLAVLTTMTFTACGTQNAANAQLASSTSVTAVRYTSLGGVDGLLYQVNCAADCSMNAIMEAYAQGEVAMNDPERGTEITGIQTYPATFQEIVATLKTDYSANGGSSANSDEQLAGFYEMVAAGAQFGVSREVSTFQGVEGKDTYNVAVLTPDMQLIVIPHVIATYGL
jgi:hypothetical protein